MNRLSLFFFLLGLAAIATCAGAQATQPVSVAAPTTRSISVTTRPSDQILAELIAQAMSDDEKVRKAAVEKLVAYGDAIEPDVEKAERHAAEVHARIESALKQIQLSGRLGPTKVSLHVKDVPLQQVLDQLSKETRVKLEIQNRGFGADAGKITLDIDDKPFWLVMKEICEKTGVGPAPYNYGRADQIVLMGGSGFAKYPAVVSGPFYIVVQSANRSHSVSYGQSESRSASANLQLAIFVDPRVRVLRGQYNLTQPEIVDEKGNSLVYNSGSYGPSYTSYTGYVHQSNVQLRYEDGFGQKIAKLRGKLQFTVRSKAQIWEIDDLAKAKDLSKEFPTGKFTIKTFTKQNEGQYQVQVQIDASSKSGQGAEAMLEYGAVQGSMKLMDANGKLWSSSGGGGGRSNNVYNYSFSFYRGGPEMPGAPTKLVWEIPTASQELTVPIEFKDLPLP